MDLYETIKDKQMLDIAELHRFSAFVCELIETSNPKMNIEQLISKINKMGFNIRDIKA